MTAAKHSFLLGARAVSPILLGVIPFGLICGAVGVSLGMPEWSVMALSAVIFAGAAQLAAMQLLAEDASVAVIVLTGLVINARFLMYSASIAPHLSGVSPFKKTFLAYFLTDQAYAVSLARFEQADADAVLKPAYYLGAGTLMWFGFNLSTVAGATLGSLIPPEWSLDFGIPLTFIALVIPAVKDRPALLAAVVSGGVAFLADPLPYNLGLMTAACAGIATGTLAERRLRRG